MTSAETSIRALLGIRGIKTGQIRSAKQLKFFVSKMFDIPYPRLVDADFEKVHEEIQTAMSGLRRAERLAQAKMGLERLREAQKDSRYFSTASKFFREDVGLDNGPLTDNEKKQYRRIRYPKKAKPEEDVVPPLPELRDQVIGNIITFREIVGRASCATAAEADKWIEENQMPITIPEDSQRFHVGEYVTKFGGDYSFEGWVVAAYQKRSGVWRYVIEDSRGMNMIMNGSQIAKAHEPDLTDL